MSYYITCPDCGCNLDPGEKCDCKGQRVFEDVRNGTASNVFVYTNTNSGNIPAPVKRTA